MKGSNSSSPDVPWKANSLGDTVEMEESGKNRIKFTSRFIQLLMLLQALNSLEVLFLLDRAASRKSFPPKGCSARHMYCTHDEDHEP